MINHCYSADINKGGGVETYLTSLLNYQIPGVRDCIIPSLKNIDQSQFKLLHLHGPECGEELLGEIRGECPVIYTLHNHNIYCPSGNKYLNTSKTCCDRNMSYLGCTWGHIVDGCGSRRPQKILQNLQRANWELYTLKKLKIPIIANSDYVRGQIIANGLPPEQIITLRCGIQIPKTAAEPLTTEIHKAQRILFAGRIVPSKGLDWLIKALVQTSPQIQLDIAGEGWARLQMEKLAKRLGVSDRITWHGWCNNKKLDELYQKCFAVIFPSVWPEPAGLITLEAYARYRPVIASAVGGIPEHLRHGQTGLLVSSNNIEQLAAAITELAQNYQQSLFMGEQSHAWLLQEFTLNIHIQRLLKIYEQCIAQFQDQNNYSLTQVI